MLQDYMINGIIPGSYTNPTEQYTTICHEHNPVFTQQSITANQTNAQTN